MTDLDDQSDEVRGKGKRESGGGSVTDIQDPRVSAALNWVWTVLGSLALLIGVGMYNKLANMNDTLLVAVSKLETQGNQINDLRAEMGEIRKENASLRTQIAVLEGKAERGFRQGKEPFRAD